MRRGFTLVELAVSVGILCLLTMVLWPTCIGSSRLNRYRWQCQNNLRQISQSFKQYTLDYDGSLPIAQTNSRRGWANLVQPYGGGWTIFQCPQNGAGRNASLTDYFYNARLSERKINTVSVPSSTILLGDGDLESLANTAISELPKDWRTNEASPVYRHLDGANYAFIDGHVKWFQQKNLTLNRPKKADVYTFLPQ